MEYKIYEQPPTPGEYCGLRALCGLGPRTIEAAKISLPRSLYAVSIRDQSGKLIGMGRVVGDLGSHVQVVDIAVDPAYQKRGLSRKIKDRITHFVETEVPECAFVNLFADIDYLYQKYGFEYPVSKGMFLNRSALQERLGKN